MLDNLAAQTERAGTFQGENDLSWSTLLSIRPLRVDAFNLFSQIIIE